MIQNLYLFLNLNRYRKVSGNKWLSKKKNKFLKYQTNLTLSLERVNLNLRKKGLILNDFKTNKKNNNTNKETFCIFIIDTYLKLIISILGTIYVLSYL